MENEKIPSERIRVKDCMKEYAKDFELANEKIKAV